MAFVNLQRLLDLNKDKGEAMAQKAIGNDGLTQGAESSIALMRGGLNNGAEAASRVSQAQQRAKVVADANAPTGLDAALMGRSQTMQGYQQRTKNLQGLMSGAQVAQQSRAAHEAAMRTSTPKELVHRPETAAERQARLQRQQWAKGGYNPEGGDEYAAYSDWIQTGRR